VWLNILTLATKCTTFIDPMTAFVYGLKIVAKLNT
jgi:hypothetical protein